MKVPRAHFEDTKFAASWYGSDGRGRSSDAMVRFVLGGPKPKTGEYPLDWADFGRCLGAYRMAPLRLRQAMTPVLCDYAEYVVAHIRQIAS